MDTSDPFLPDTPPSHRSFLFGLGPEQYQDALDTTFESQVPISEASTSFHSLAPDSAWPSPISHHGQHQHQTTPSNAQTRRANPSPVPHSPHLPRVPPSSSITSSTLPTASASASATAATSTSTSTTARTAQLEEVNRIRFELLNLFVDASSYLTSRTPRPPSSFSAAAANAANAANAAAPPSVPITVPQMLLQYDDLQTRILQRFVLALGGVERLAAQNQQNQQSQLQQSQSSATEAECARLRLELQAEQDARAKSESFLKSLLADKMRLQDQIAQAEIHSDQAQIAVNQLRSRLRESEAQFQETLHQKYQLSASLRESTATVARLQEEAAALSQSLLKYQSIPLQKPAAPVTVSAATATIPITTVQRSVQTEASASRLADQSLETFKERDRPSNAAIKQPNQPAKDIPDYANSASLQPVQIEAGGQNAIGSSVAPVVQKMPEPAATLSRATSLPFQNALKEVGPNPVQKASSVMGNVFEHNQLPTVKESNDSAVDSRKSPPPRSEISTVRGRVAGSGSMRMLDTNVSFGYGSIHDKSLMGSVNMSNASMMAMMAMLSMIDDDDGNVDIATENQLENKRERKLSESFSSALVGIGVINNTNTALVDKMVQMFPPPQLSNSSIDYSKKLSDPHLKIIRKAYLVKKSDRILRSVKKILAIVHGWRLYIFSSENESQILDVIELSQSFATLPPGLEDDGMNFYLHTPEKIIHYGCLEGDDRNKWISTLRDVGSEGKILLDTSLSQRFIGLHKQGYLLVARKDGSTQPTELKWCFAAENVFGYFKDPKNPKKIHIVDLSRADVSMSRNRLRENTFIIQYASENYTLTATTDAEAELWQNIISCLIENAKAAINDPEFWQGYLKKKSKGLLGRSKDFWYVVKEDRLTAFADLNILEVVASYELDGASVRVIDKSTFELIMTDGTTSTFSSSNTEEVRRCTETIQRTINRIKLKYQGVIRKGYLNFKKEDTGRGVKRDFKYYWFVLTKDVLTYYESQKALKPKKSLSLLSIRLTTPENYIEDCTFLLNLPSKVLRFVGSDGQIVSQWVEDLRAAINNAELEARRKKRGSMTLTSRNLALFFDPRRASSPGGPDAVPEEKEDAPAQTIKKVNANDTGKDEDNLDVDDDDRFSQGTGEHVQTDVKRRNSLPTKMSYRGYRPGMDSPVVIDNGSSYLRIGFSKDELPAAIFPSTVCYNNLENISEFYVGYNAQRQQSILGLKPVYPFMAGQEINWDSAVDLYSYAFTNELNIETRNHSFLLTEPVGFKDGDTDKFLEIMIEVFEADGVCVEAPGALPLFAIGESTGIVLDWGNRLSITPVYDGRVLSEGCHSINFGGRHLNSYLYQILNKECGFHVAEKKMDIASSIIKEKFCYVASDFNKECTDTKSGRRTLRKDFVLDRSGSISLESQRFRVPEVMFNPSIGGFEFESVQQLVQKAVQTCPIDLRRELCQNIVLSGGSTLFPGFSARLQRELTQLNPSIPATKIRQEGLSKYLTWMGGAILTLDESFGKLCVRRDAYHEEGAHRILNDDF